MSNGISGCGSVARSQPFDPTVSPPTVHPRWSSVARLDSKTGFFIVMPTLAGGTHHYGHLFMQTNLSTSQGGDHTHRPKLDYFRRDLVNGWLANYKTLPFTFLEIKTYINQATTTLMGADKIKDIWTLKPSHRWPCSWVSSNPIRPDQVKAASRPTTTSGRIRMTTREPGSRWSYWIEFRTPHGFHSVGSGCNWPCRESDLIT